MGTTRFGREIALAVALTIAGCKGAGTISSSAPASDAAVALPSPAPEASAAAATTACDLTRGFLGNVARKRVFMRLARRPDGVVGRYAYADVGVDIPLRGTLDDAGALTLVEGDPARPTGRFAGRCDPGTNRLEGTWSSVADPKGADAGAARSAPFALERVLPRPQPLGATKKHIVKRPVKSVGPLGMKACSYEESWFEVYGLGSAEAEQRLNEAPLDVVTPRVSLPDELASVKACDTGIDATYATTLEPWGPGFATVTSGGSVMMDGAAHPANHVGYRAATVDLRTGERVKPSDVLASLPDEVLAACIGVFARDRHLDVEMVRSNVSRDKMVLRPEGILFYGSDYGHALGVLTGDGPVLTWAALVRDKRLVERSPYARAWADVAPAASSAPVCITRKAP